MRRSLLLALVLALAACGGGGEAEDGAPGERAPETNGIGDGCRDVEEPDARPAARAQPPKRLLAPTKTYRVAVVTSCGTFTIALNRTLSPKTAASFVALVRRDFFDGTAFHRIVPGFVIQGGDPSGTGGGGPGYTTVDRPPPGTRYTRGVVAMAKTQAEAAGTAGSQFFVVTADDAGLPPDYAVLGKVIRGLEVVDRIESLGDAATELPTRPAVIDDMRLETASRP